MITKSPFSLIFLLVHAFCTATNYYTRDAPATRGCWGATSFSNISHSGAIGVAPPSIVPLGDSIVANHLGCSFVDTTASGTSTGCDCTFGPSTLRGALIVRSGARFVWNGSLLLEPTGSILVEAGGILEIAGSISTNPGATIQVDGQLELSASVLNQVPITGTGCFVCAGSVSNSGSGDFFGDNTAVIPCGAANACIGNIVLPISYLGGELSSGKYKATLSWSTLKESNNSRFEIKVFQNDGEKVHEGVVPGTNQLSYIQSYEYEIPSLLPGLVRVELWQYDYGSEGTLIEVFMGDITGTGQAMDVFPSIVRDILNFSFEMDAPETVNVQIFNSLGNIVFFQRASEVEELRGELDLSNLPKGVYQAAFLWKGGKACFKFRKV